MQTSSKKKATRHLSLQHEKLGAKRKAEKSEEIERAIKYCKEHNCRGYKAISELNLQFVSDARTINKHLDGKVVTGNEKAYQRILTVEEEKKLVTYIINRNRACQGLTDTDAEGVVLNLLRVRQQRNARRFSGQRVPLSSSAEKALKTKHIGKSFFRRFNTEHDTEVTRKIQQKVSAKRGLHCTREIAINYIDELASHLIEAGIAPDIVKEEPGVWKGSVDLSRIWAHDETPQFINYSSIGQSRKRVYAGAGHDSNKMTKQNRECVTIHPFSNFAGDLAMCQVIFSGSGMTSHMCPPAAAAKISNLVISVNESGCTTGETLLAAYEELSAIIEERKVDEEEVHVVLADGHKSRFNAKVMDHCIKSYLDQHLIPPDTSGVTQKHDQINQQLHSSYEKKKTEMFSEYADLNRECFMNIVAEIWNQWATPERITKAGKRVGVSKDGLDINWMDQSKFEQAAAILSPPTPTKEAPEPQIESPQGVRKDSVTYWKAKYLQRTKQVEVLEAANTNFEIENVPGLMPYKKVKPSETVRRKITDVHGSLKATNVRELIMKKEEEEQEKELKKAERIKGKEEMKEIFGRCKDKCVCERKVCMAIKLQKCSICGCVQRSKCTKKGCKVAGISPVMIFVAVHEKKGRKSKKNEESVDTDEVDEEEESEEEFLGFEDEGSDDSLGQEVDDDAEEDLLFTAEVAHKSDGMEAIRKVQEDLGDDQNGKFFAVFYENGFYWGKSVVMFADDPDACVDTVHLNFMHRRHDGFWDWPKKEDMKAVPAMFIVYGPVDPPTPTKRGFKFPDEEAEKQYRLYKKSYQK